MALYFVAIAPGCTIKIEASLCAFTQTLEGSFQSKKLQRTCQGPLSLVSCCLRAGGNLNFEFWEQNESLELMIFVMSLAYWSLWGKGGNMKRQAISMWIHFWSFQKQILVANELLENHIPAAERQKLLQPGEPTFEMSVWTRRMTR